MKKIGTISTAVGFIFLGTWMIIRRINPAYGNEIFKWWYLIFILFGVELLVNYFKSKSNTEIKSGFNYLFILVVAILLSINVFQVVRSDMKNVFNNTGRRIVDKKFNRMFENFNGDYDILNVNKTINVNSNKLYIKGNNSDFQIKKSPDNVIRISGKVYVEKGTKSYDPKYENDNGENIIDFNENFVKGERCIIYLPDNMNLKLDAGNIRFNSFGDSSINYDIKSDNGTVDIKNSKISGDININNGIININSKDVKNLNANLDNGTVYLKTSNKNADFNLQLERGICSLNNTSKTNCGIEEKHGTGEDKINIKVSNGTIGVKSK